MSTSNIYVKLSSAAAGALDCFYQASLIDFPSDVWFGTFNPAMSLSGHTTGCVVKKSIKTLFDHDYQTQPWYYNFIVGGLAASIGGAVKYYIRGAHIGEGALDIGLYELSEFTDAIAETKTGILSGTITENTVAAISIYTHKPLGVKETLMERIIESGLKAGIAVDVTSNFLYAYLPKAISCLFVSDSSSENKVSDIQYQQYRNDTCYDIPMDAIGLCPMNGGL